MAGAVHRRYNGAQIGPLVAYLAERVKLKAYFE